MTGHDKDVTIIKELVKERPLTDVFTAEERANPRRYIDGFEPACVLWRNDKNSLLGGFIVRKPITGQQRANFKTFMADAGVVEINGNIYPKLQMLTVRDILEGTRFQMPYSLGHRLSPQLEMTEQEVNA